MTSFWISIERKTFLRNKEENKIKLKIVLSLARLCVVCAYIRTHVILTLIPAYIQFSQSLAISKVSAAVCVPCFMVRNEPKQIMRHDYHLFSTRVWSMTLNSATLSRYYKTFFLAFFFFLAFCLMLCRHSTFSHTYIERATQFAVRAFQHILWWNNKETTYTNTQTKNLYILIKCLLKCHWQIRINHARYIHLKLFANFLLLFTVNAMRWCRALCMYIYKSLTIRWCAFSIMIFHFHFVTHFTSCCRLLYLEL